MGRPRTFSCDEVLDTVIAVFRKHGYDGTSFAELEQHTGVRKASLFAAFGDKDDLFCRALERYQEQQLNALRRCCRDRVPQKEILRQWLNDALRDQRDGCLSVKALLESDRPRCREQVRRYFRTAESLLESIISEGIQSRSFRKTTDPAIGAKLLLSALTGAVLLSSGSRNGLISRRQLPSIVEAILAAL